MAVLQRQSIAACVLLTVLLLTERFNVADAHGMILDPPGRSSMWRFGFNVPENYDDNGLNCGGQGKQYDEVNQGRCGECGDEWSISRPRLHDEGGLYGTGIIGQTWITESVVRLMVNITANHLGYFEFRLCPKQSANELVTQECLDRHLLEIVDQPGTGGQADGTKFRIGSAVGYYFPVVKLPTGITCENCVLQWYYTTGNSPGQCGPNQPDEALCNQESFVNCADVKIVPK